MFNEIETVEKMVIDNTHLVHNVILQPETFNVSLFDDKINEKFIVGDKNYHSFRY